MSRRARLSCTCVLSSVLFAACVSGTSGTGDGTGGNWLEIKDASGTVAFKGDIITGPKATDYAVGPLAAGTYQFVCTVHPAMTGTLTVK